MSTKTPCSQENYKFLTGLRGLTALYVVYFHVVQATNFSGSLGIFGQLLTWWGIAGIPAVTVFIVLSGFLLNLQIIREKRLPGGISGFLSRRAWRILPPYSASLLCSAGLVLFLQPAAFGDVTVFGHHASSPNVGWDIATHLLLIHNLCGSSAYVFNGALWSVATEWQIYIVFCLILVPARLRFGPVAAAFCGIGLAVLAELQPSDAQTGNAALWMVGCFALGGLAAEVAEGSLAAWLPILPVDSAAAIGLTAIGVWMGVTAFGHGARLYMAINWLAAFTTCAGILAIIRGGIVSRITRETFESRAVAGLGDFSYSLYLTHAPIVMLADAKLRAWGLGGEALLAMQIVVVMPLAIAVAYLFYITVEKPSMRRRFGTTSHYRV